jgi:hypothetical protein
VPLLSGDRTCASLLFKAQRIPDVHPEEVHLMPSGGRNPAPSWKTAEI